MHLGQAAARYLGNLKGGQRELAASEINRFVRHMGAERPVTGITKLEVERPVLTETALQDISSKKFATDRLHL